MKLYKPYQHKKILQFFVDDSEAKEQNGNLKKNFYK